jgi:Peptidase A4 family
MNIQRLIYAVAVAGSIAAAAAPSASAATTEGQSASSANWSGYVVGGTSGNATKFSSVSGSWTEPSVNCNSGQGYSAFWVGLGGAGQQSQALEQTGTEADCSSGGSASHFAWYELVPAAPVRMDLEISPGDHISAKATVDGTDVTVSLTDSTTGQSATKNLTMQNPATESAEWIAEAPSQCDGTGNCQPLALANFGKVNFTDASATANGHTGTISDPSWASQPVQLNAGAGQSGAGGFVSDAASAGATPSSLSSDGSAFSVAWASTVDPASAPGSASASGDGYSGAPSAADGGYPGDGYGYGSSWGDGSGYGYGDGGWGAYGYGYTWW